MRRHKTQDQPSGSDTGRYPARLRPVLRTGRTFSHDEAVNMHCSTAARGAYWDHGHAFRPSSRYHLCDVQLHIYVCRCLVCLLGFVSSSFISSVMFSFHCPRPHILFTSPDHRSLLHQCSHYHHHYLASCLFLPTTRTHVTMSSSRDSYAAGHWASSSGSWSSISTGWLYFVVQLAFNSAPQQNFQ